MANTFDSIIISTGLVDLTSKSVLEAADAYKVAKALEK